MSSPDSRREPSEAGSGQPNEQNVQSVAPALVQPSHSSLQRPVFMPETFTGMGRDWSDWSEQFELAAEVNHWTEELKLKFMSLLLSGRARDIYAGLSPTDKSSYVALKVAMGKYLEPCGEEWHRVSFSSRKRLPTETAREFGNALRRLVSKAYSSVDASTQDLLARDHFMANVGSGELRIQLRSAKPPTLEDAISVATELELIRDLERTELKVESKVMGVSGRPPAGDSQISTLLSVVEGLRQEMKTLQATVAEIKNSHGQRNTAPGMFSQLGPVNASRVDPTADRNSRERGDGCWECGCTRHIRKHCPYLK